MGRINKDLNMGRKFIVEEVEEKKSWEDGPVGAVVGCGCSIFILFIVFAALRSCLGCAG